MKKTPKSAKARSNSKSPKKIYLGWVEYILLIKDLVDMIKASGIKFDYIYGPCRGGYIPAVILSHEFNVPIVRQELTGNLLVVDDIIDTAQTMNEVKECWGGWFDKIYSASLYKHKNCKYKPDFYVRDNDQWIVFPYEKE